MNEVNILTTREILQLNEQVSVKKNNTTTEDLVKACDEWLETEWISTERVKDAIPRIIQLFASIDDMGVWGYDTEIFSTKKEAIEAILKELGLENKNG